MSSKLLKKYKREKKREHNKQAAQMGLTRIDYGLLKYAYLKAELSAKRNETLDQTRARAKEIWHEEVQKRRKYENGFMNAIMLLPEKERRKLIARMRKSC